jgi:hypothetical protein
MEGRAMVDLYWWVEGIMEKNHDPPRSEANLGFSPRGRENYGETYD